MPVHRPEFPTRLPPPMRTLLTRAWLFLPLFVLLVAGCSKLPVVRTHFRWIVGREMPAFDPLGPPDPVRDALGALLTRSLLRTDSLGRPALDAADRVAVSNDRLRYTFTLKRGLAFTDGRPCDSEAFRAGLLAGIGRSDHGTFAWRLAALRGMEQVRPRRPLPALGITAPDPLTLVLDLAIPDSLLLDKLAAPGATAVWESLDVASDWRRAVGLGPYRTAPDEMHSLLLLRTAGHGPDSVSVRFAAGAPRVRSFLRHGDADLVWPVPAALSELALGEGWKVRNRPASPERRLSLVFRADVPPMHKLAARRVFAHGIERGELPRRLGVGAREVGEWLPGAGPADLPGLDQHEIETWLDRGKLGRSVHATLAYDADAAGGALARGLQFDWARSGLYADLQPLRGGAFTTEALTGQTQMLLVEEQGLIPGPAGILAGTAMPLRGPAVGAYRTGWRTRDFDPWILPRRSPARPDLRFARQRLEEETVVLPLVALDWIWVERVAGPPVGFDPRTGPGPVVFDGVEIHTFRR